MVVALKVDHSAFWCEAWLAELMKDRSEIALLQAKLTISNDSS
ncbi:hypothetical protein [Larkinella humicola]|nr:hypothetical protein [Larkinella humicola]